MAAEIETLSDKTLHISLSVKAQALAQKRAELAQLQDAIVALVEESDRIKEELAARKLAEMAQAGVLDWPWLLASGDATTRKQLNHLEACLRIEPRVPYCYGVGTGSGHDDRTQHALSIQLVKDHPELTQQVLARLNEVLPHVELLMDHKGRAAKHVDIMEASLSLHGRYYMVINEEANLFEVHHRNYGRPSIVTTAPDLASLLNFVEQELFYKTCADLKH